MVLIAAFLGMSIGCVSASRARPDWMVLFPALAATAVLAATALFTTYQLFPHLAIDVGTQAPGSSLIFFGTEYRNIDLANFVIPMELVCGFFFVLVLAMFIGPGQILGRCFLSDPDRVRAYAANIAGAVLGRFAEYLTMLLGFQVLVLVALAFYALSSMGRMGGAVR